MLNAIVEIKNGFLGRTAPGACLCVLLVACAPPAEEFESGTAIEHVTVVHVESGELSTDQTVVVQGSRIVAVAPADRIVLADVVERVDGAGRFLIPGLWDMHVHEFNPGMFSGLRQHIANGVTGVRDMFGTLSFAAEQGALIAEGDLAGPRFVIAGNIVDGENPWIPGSVVAASPERGREVVDSLAAAGAGFIKVYSVMEAEVFAAIAERAEAVGLYVAGHVPFAVTAADASDMGMRSMTHMFGVTEGCSSVEAEIRATRAEWLVQRATGEATRNPFFDPGLYRQMLDSPDDTACGALLEGLVGNQTWLVPTGVALRSISHLDDPAITGDPRTEYVPPSLTEMWALWDDFLSDASDDPTARDEYYRRQLELVGRASAAGVGILAGTDTPNPYVFQGFSLHDELELLVEAGLSAQEALAAATLNPARFLGATDSLGSVGVGKLADLVLLEANPLQDIGNTRRIHAVMANGRLFTRAALDELLEEVKREAAGG